MFRIFTEYGIMDVKATGWMDAIQEYIDHYGPEYEIEAIVFLPTHT